jgi:hypothetical protein
VGGIALGVVTVRPLLGENHTNSMASPLPGSGSSAISGPVAPDSRRSAFRARFASCFALR